MNNINFTKANSLNKEIYRDIKVKKLTFDGISFNDNIRKINNIFGMKLIYLETFYSFWVSAKKNKVYWRTLEGIPKIKEEGIPYKLNVSDKIKIRNFEKEGTLQLFKVNKYSEDVFGINGQNFYEVNYKTLRLKNGRLDNTRWNYKTFIALYNKEENTIYKIELRQYSKKILENYLEKIKNNENKELKILSSNSWDIEPLGNVSINSSQKDFLKTILEEDIYLGNKNIAGSKNTPSRYFIKQEDLIISFLNKNKLFTRRDLEIEKESKNITVIQGIATLFIINVLREKLKEGELFDIKDNKSSVSFLQENIVSLVKGTIYIKKEKERKNINKVVNSFFKELVIKIKNTKVEKKKIRKKENIKEKLIINIIKEYKDIGEKIIRKKQEENKKKLETPKKGIENVWARMTLKKEDFIIGKGAYFLHTKENPFRADLLKKITRTKKIEEAHAIIEKSKLSSKIKDYYKKIITILSNKNNTKILFEMHTVVGKNEKAIVFYKKNLKKGYKKNIDSVLKGIRNRLGQK